MSSLDLVWARLRLIPLAISGAVQWDKMDG
jgi:hypothetical protein